MNEGSGSTMSPSVGAIDLNLNGGYSWVSGFETNAIKFTKAGNGYAVSASNPGISGTTTWSFSVLAKVPSSISGNNTLFSLGQASGGNFFGLGYESRYEQGLFWQGSGIGGVTAFASGVDMEQWHLYTVTFDGVNDINLYVDNTLVRNQTAAINLNDFPIYLGGRVAGFNGDYSDATMNEAYVWTKELSGVGGEVTDLYNNFFATPISTFNQATATYGESVTSTVSASSLVTAIQDAGTDTYFDSTSEVASVEVRYLHQDGRQKTDILHVGPGLQGNTSWASVARDGTWQKHRIVVHDAAGASAVLQRADIGTSEDLVMTDGTMALNT